MGIGWEGRHDAQDTSIGEVMVAIAWVKTTDRGRGAGDSIWMVERHRIMATSKNSVEGSQHAWDQSNVSSTYQHWRITISVGRPTMRRDPHLQ